MNDFVMGVRGLVDQLNPLSKPNLIIYFIWLFVFFFTATAVWRSHRGFTRFCCYVVNQIFSVGLLISTLQVVVPAVLLWRESILVIVVALTCSWVSFRRSHRPKEEAVPKAQRHPPPLQPGYADGLLPPPRATLQDERLNHDDVRRLSDRWANRQLPPQN